MKCTLLLISALTLTGCTFAEPLRIVCIGDSLTSCGGSGGRFTDHLAARLPEANIINKGVAGDTLGGGRARFEKDVLALHPDVVIIGLGANDFWQAKRPLADLAADLKYLVSAAREAGAQVVIASCFGDVDQGDPSPEFTEDRRSHYARGIARFERELVAQFGCFYVPNMQADIKPVADHPEFWNDNNHPNRAGNERVARRILKELQKALEAARAVARTSLSGT